MNPFETKKVELQQFFSILHPIQKDHYDNQLHAKTTLWNAYHECCLTINEISGICYHVIGDEVYAVPKFIKGADKSLREYIVGKHRESIFSNDKSDYTENFGLRNYWELGDFIILKNLQKFTDPHKIMYRALLVANMVLNRSPRILGVVCGPMSTGIKTVEENFRIFNRTVYKVGQQMDIFNQLPFERPFNRVHQLLHSTHKHLLVDGKSSPYIIEQFYRKIFLREDKVWLPSFIHNWESSTGADIEHKIFTAISAEIIQLEEGFEKDLF